MKFNKFKLLLIGLLIVVKSSTAQDKIVVYGQVYGINNTTDLLTLFVVSQIDQTGNFGNYNGTYKIIVNRLDTVIVGSIGYHTQKLGLQTLYYRIV